MVIRSTGISTVEEIITLRYSLYNHLFWNKPNRTMIAMIKWVLLSLQAIKGFLGTMRDHVLTATENSVLQLLSDEATRANMVPVMEICQLLMPDRPNMFEELLQFNRAEGEANADKLCGIYEDLTVQVQKELQDRMNAEFIRTFGLVSDRQHVLIDLPIEPGPINKLGEDINVLTHMGTMKAINQVSSIVKGVQDGFRLHLQRLRIFVHPETWKTLNDNPEMRTDVEDALRCILRSLI